MIVSVTAVVVLLLLSAFFSGAETALTRASSAFVVDQDKNHNNSRAKLVNRLFDAVDGGIARRSKVTEFGIFLDAALDYIFYTGIIFGFAMANPAENAVAASFLLFGFAASACAMLAYAIVAYKDRSLTDMVFDRSPFYLGGFAQGAETFVAIVLMCLIPGWFLQLAILFGILCLIKAVSIIITAYYNFVIMADKK